MGTFILFLTLWFPAYIAAQSVTLEQTALEYLATEWGPELAKYVAIDQDKDLVYVTGDTFLTVLEIGENFTLSQVDMIEFPDMKLNQVRQCNNFITIVMGNASDPAMSYLEVYKVYNKKTSTLENVNQIPLRPSPGFQRHSSDCKTVVVPISERPYTSVDGVDMDGDGAIMIIKFDKNNLGGTYSTNTLTFDSFSSQQLALSLNGALFEPTVGFAQGIEPVDTCFSSDETKAYVVLSSNNIVATVDMVGETIESLNGLGTKDYRIGGGLDANNKDDINFANYDIRGAFTPSRIDCFAANGNEYFVTGNDGTPPYRNVIRLERLTLDPTLFPDTRFQKKRFAGRLKVWNGGDIDGDGDIDTIYAIGARSVSIWFASSVTLVADTGSMVEEKIADLMPNYFNADPRDSTRTIQTSKDLRSILRGPEPKPVKVFNTCNDRYLIAVVGLEMPGGLMVFSLDYTNPAAGFTFMSLEMPFSGNRGETWGALWGRQDASMMAVQSFDIYDDRNPVVFVGGQIGSTLSGYKLNIVCSG